jgi:hypothetical protein
VLRSSKYNWDVNTQRFELVPPFFFLGSGRCWYFRTGAIGLSSMVALLAIRRLDFCNSTLVKSNSAIAQSGGTRLSETCHGSVQCMEVLVGHRPCLDCLEPNTVTPTIVSLVFGHICLL